MKKKTRNEIFRDILHALVDTIIWGIIGIINVILSVIMDGDTLSILFIIGAISIIIAFIGMIRVKMYSDDLVRYDEN